MYTRTFVRDYFSNNYNKDIHDEIKISEYGFEWRENGVLVRTGLVDDIDSDIESLIEEGFEEI